MSDTIVNPAAPLTAVDRCDRCGAQAYIRFTMKSGLELLMCAHHNREHGEKAKLLAVHVHSELKSLEK